MALLVKCKCKCECVAGRITVRWSLVILQLHDVDELGNANAHAPSPPAMRSRLEAGGYADHMVNDACHRDAYWGKSKPKPAVVLASRMAGRTSDGPLLVCLSKNESDRWLPRGFWNECSPPPPPRPAPRGLAFWFSQVPVLWGHFPGRLDGHFTRFAGARFELRNIQSMRCSTTYSYS